MLDSFRELFECSPVPLIVTDAESECILGINEAARTLLRTDLAALGRKPFDTLCVRDHPINSNPLLNAAHAADRIQVLQRSDGTHIVAAIRSRNLRSNETQRRLHAIVDHADEDDYRYRTAARVRDAARQAALARAIPAAMWQTDRTLRLLASEGAAVVRLFTQPPQLGEFAIQQFPPDSQLALLRAHQEALNGTPTHLDVALKAYHFSATLEPMRDAKGVIVGVIGVALDTTQHKNAEARLSYLAHNDELSGLPNRRLFVSRLAALLAAGDADYGVLMIDLNGFKLINDTLGHTVGDRLIDRVGSDLRDLAQMRGALVARFGGDEFAVAFPATTNDEPVRFAQEIADHFSHPLRIDDREVFLTVSIGVSQSPMDGITAEMLIANADTAMYRVKSTMRSGVGLFSSEMRESSLLRMRLEQELRAGVHRKEFTLCYQPIFSFQTGKISAIEALVRWNHPSAGRIAPDQFMALAEESGLILELGYLVLREACRQIAQWRAQFGTAPRMCVNVSARQFADPRFLQRVREETARFKLPAGALELELTETAALVDRQHTRDLLRELSTIGISTAIDDFGTGYSSLGYLQALPVQTVKIDRTLVSQVATQPLDRIITESVLRVAGHLGIRVIAEGIETEAQAQALLALGCYEMQGFFFSEPLEAERMHELLAAPVRIGAPICSSRAVV